MNKKMMMFLMSLALPGMVMSSGEQPASFIARLKVFPKIEWKDFEITSVQNEYKTPGRREVWSSRTEYNELLANQSSTNEIGNSNIDNIEGTKHTIAKAADCSHAPYRLISFSGLIAALSGVTAVGGLLFKNQDAAKYGASFLVASTFTATGATLWRSLMLKNRDGKMTELATKLDEIIQKENSTGAGANSPVSSVPPVVEGGSEVATPFTNGNVKAFSRVVNQVPSSLVE